jgi:hypothetical protein
LGFRLWFDVGFWLVYFMIDLLIFRFDGILLVSLIIVLIELGNFLFFLFGLLLVF